MGRTLNIHSEQALGIEHSVTDASFLFQQIRDKLAGLFAIYVDDCQQTGTEEFVTMRNVSKRSSSACTINNPNGGRCMHSPSEDPCRRRGGRTGQGKRHGTLVAVSRAGGSRARKSTQRSKSTPRRPRAALGDVPVPTGGGRSLHARARRARYSSPSLQTCARESRTWSE